MLEQQQQSCAITSASIELADVADQRRFRRYMGIENGVLRLAVRPEFRGRRALIVDLSAGGIGFLVEDNLAVGSVLVFELKGRNLAGMMGRFARVRHCRPHPVPADAPWLPQKNGFSNVFRQFLGISDTPQGNAWLVGCEFDHPFDEDEIKQLVEQLTSDQKS
jgi:hypothetical protein